MTILYLKLKSCFVLSKQCYSRNRTNKQFEPICPSFTFLSLSPSSLSMCLPFSQAKKAWKGHRRIEPFREGTLRISHPLATRASVYAKKRQWTRRRRRKRGGNNSAYANTQQDQNRPERERKENWTLLFFLSFLFPQSRLRSLGVKTSLLLFRRIKHPFVRIDRRVGLIETRTNI